MQRDKLEQINESLFNKLNSAESVGSVGGFTILITYKPTFVNGIVDRIASDALQD